MKKLLAWTLILMLALPMCALAETEAAETDAIATDGMVNMETLSERFSEEEEELTWETLSERLPEVVENGAFFNLEDLGLKIWIPDELVMIVDDTPGVVEAFYQDDLKHGFEVILNALLEEMDPEIYDIGYLDVSRADEGSSFTSAVNGIPCVLYTLDEETRVCAALRLDDGRAVTFLFETPEGSGDDWIIKTVLMITSIQPMDD